MGPSELSCCLLRELRTTTADRPDDDERDERDQERVLREILPAFVQAAPVLGGRALSVVSWPPKEPAGLH